MHILVTGGAGYIGSHTCKMLKEEGFTPVTYDNLSTGHKYLVKWGPLVVGDLRDQETLSSVFKKYPIQAVIHFAAHALVCESMQFPFKYYSNNVEGSLALLHVMQEHNVLHIIFSSSCATYGHPQTTPITEEHAQNPISPYGMSKLMIEKILLDMAKTNNCHPVILRYFNAAGASGDIGEHHEMETHLVPNILLAIMHNQPIHVFGTDFDTPDGTAIRDYIHVDDLAEAHIAALKRLMKDHQPLELNLGTGMGISVQEMVDLCIKETKQRVQTIYEPRRSGDPSILVACNKKSQEYLGWTPKYSHPENIVQSAWRWHQKKR